MGNELIARKIEEFKIYDPYDLFEVDRKSVRLKDNNEGLEDLCSNIEQIKESRDILKLEDGDFNVKIRLVQDFYLPKKCKIDKSNLHFAKRLLSKTAKKFVVSGDYAYSIIPLYSLESDFSFKNNFNCQSDSDLSNKISSILKGKGIDNELGVIKSTKVEYKDINQFSSSENLEKYTMLIHNNWIYIFPKTEIIFKDRYNSKKILQLKQTLSENEESKFKDLIDIADKLGLVEQNKNLIGCVNGEHLIKPFECNKEDYPIIQLGNFNYLMPNLTKSKYGLKYITGQYIFPRFVYRENVLNNLLELTSSLFGSRDSLENSNKFENLEGSSDLSLFGTVQSFRIITSGIGLIN